jgi:hypothetical protein
MSTTLLETISSCPDTHCRSKQRKTFLFFAECPLIREEFAAFWFAYVGE